MLNLDKYIVNSFPAKFREFLLKLGILAKEQGQPAYLVGGFVRDLLLGHPSADIDIMLVGDATCFVKYLYKNWDATFADFEHPTKPIIFKRYKTAKLPFKNDIFKGENLIDFSSARKEFYPESGAIPVVSEGTLEDDLARRDFSINALALSLNEENFLSVIDHFAGLKDLEKRQIRIIHNKSFFDDPARLIRAVRMIVRLEFSMEEDTMRLFEEAVARKYLANLPKRRLLDEFNKALSENLSEKILKKLDSTGLLLQCRELGCS